MKNELKNLLIHELIKKTDLSVDLLTRLIERPKNPEHGDLAFPCFALAKIRKVSPPDCATSLQSELELPTGFSEVYTLGPFLNFRFEKKVYLEGVVKEKLSATKKSKNSKKIIVEYSSPNIAKPFHVGHLRATLIGNSLDRVYRYLNYNTTSINHLGDWGTQFGFVWAGCELWGKPEKPTVSALVDLYRRATQLKEDQEANKVRDEDAKLPDINLKARDYFIDLEKGEDYAVEFWQWCKDISLKYLKETYDRLDISFDHYTGESFYSDMLDDVKQELEAAKVLEESQGALGIDLGEKTGFARIFTPDGRSLYLTRDLAAADYRAKEFNFDKALYVVGAPQSLHFEQIKGVLSTLKKDYADKIEHVAFGHVMGMKTRGGGTFIELNDFLDEAYERSLKAYHEQVTRRPEGLDEKEVATGVSLAAIIFSNLSRTRLKDVHFSWEHALEFQGDSGPYLLYAYARINGIKDKAEVKPSEAIDGSLLAEASAFELASELDRFSDILEDVVKDSEPAHLANYAISLAKSFSRAYNELKVSGVEENLAIARLSLFEATRLTLKTSIELLGLKILERM